LSHVILLLLLLLYIPINKGNTFPFGVAYFTFQFYPLQFPLITFFFFSILSFAVFPSNVPT
jgi:uncharacterized integral membrane protein